MSQEYKKLNVAVMGYGFLGKWHCEKVEQAGAHLYAIIDPFTENLKKAQEKYPDVLCVTSWQEVVEGADVFLIVTPTSTHFDLVQTLLSKDKHIFCEKPLCSNYEQALKLKKIVESTSALLQVGHSERFHAVWDILLTKPNLHSFLQEKSSTLILTREAPFKGRALDVDVVQDLMIHDLDLVLYLTGEMPQSVLAFGYKIRTNFYDYVCATLQFKSGRCVILKVGRNQTEEVRELETTSRLGSLKVDLMNLSYSYLQAHAEQVVTQTYPKRDHLLLEQQSFYHSIHHKQKPLVTFEDGVRAVKLVDAVLASLSSHQKVDIHE
ncbi:MAG: Gfo/Idh/MocA family oxidoreductase [Bacteriovoracaceae bacterium]|nr:Gfo/Idh/MocA family oxidoreductase [Bacteriovoracaceae bacterium]